MRRAWVNHTRAETFYTYRGQQLHGNERVQTAAPRPKMAIAGKREKGKKSIEKYKNTYKNTLI